MAAKIALKAATRRGRKTRRDRPNGVDTVLNKDTEGQLANWVGDLRRDGCSISPDMLRVEAIRYAVAQGIEDGAFAASFQWRKGFLARHNLSFRTKTHQGQTSPAYGEEQALRFAAEVKETIRCRGITKIYNADQTAVFFELLPKRTVNELGAKTVWVKCGSKGKERATAMVMARTDGKKCPLFLIYKAVPSKKPEPLQAQHGMQIYGNKAGWWNAAIMVKYLAFHFGERHLFSPAILLILDHFSAHWIKEVVDYAASKNIALMKVPAGMTWRCQPADVAWMKSIKDSLRKSWVKSLRTQLAHRPTGERFKMVSPTRATIAGWMQSAWDGLARDTIVHGFEKCGFMLTTVDETEHAADEGPDATDVIELLQSLGGLLLVPRFIVTDEMDVVNFPIEGDDDQ